MKSSDAKMNWIKVIAPVIVLTIVLAAAWGFLGPRFRTHDKISEGTAKLNEIEKMGVPEFKLKDLNGKEYSLESFKDKALIVNFWASWCDPCVKEFPSMIDLIKRFNGQVVLLAISADLNEADILNFMKAFGIKKDDPNIVILWDKDQAVASKFGTKQLPESYIFGPQLKLKRKVVGIEDWSTRNVIIFFEELLKGG